MSEEIKKTGEIEETEEPEELEIVETRRNPLVVIANAANYAEKARVMAQVRLKHLEKRRRTCAVTESILEWSLVFENAIDGLLKNQLDLHPTYPWFSKVKGIGSGETIGKVLGELESFGKYYPVDDSMIPTFVTREPERYIEKAPEDDEEPEILTGIWVEAIERWPTPSAMRKFGGLTPDSKRRRGELLSYNDDLKKLWFRVARNINRAGGKYYGVYLAHKERITNRILSEGGKVLPTPKSRMCPVCEVEQEVPKDTRHCPMCGSELATKVEPEGVIWQGHLHQMALRKEEQLISDHLWLVWRTALGLPVTKPYPFDKLEGHTHYIDPWDMTE